jgi:hypothetical protein
MNKHPVTEQRSERSPDRLAAKGDALRNQSIIPRPFAHPNFRYFSKRRGEKRKMKCVTVYTNNYEVFSDLFDDLQNIELRENEEREIDGVTVSDAGEVEVGYIEMMRQKPEVAVMKVKKKNITLLQHGNVFEILYHNDPPVVESTVQ